MKDLTFSPLDLDSFEFPVVAIVGRPNVGKSTLFNRFINKRKAIVDPTPGVTRDPVSERVEWDGIPMILMDTGGYKPDKEGFDALVVQKSFETLQMADLILLVMDVSQVLPEDEELIEKLRPYSKKIVLVVNKVDNTKREENVWNFYSYGFEKVIPISATHASNLAELQETIASFLKDRVPAKVESAIKAKEEGNFFVDRLNEIRVAILGQPNTGKSTLSNLLVGEGKSIVSDIAGTTRDIVEGSFTYKNQFFSLMDTAGIRRKKKVGENIEYYSVNRAITSIQEVDIVYLMIDASKGLAEQDKKIANLVVKEGRGIILVLNKWDLLPKVENQEEAIKDRIRFLFPVLTYAPVVPLSALENQGVKKLLDLSLNLYGQLNKRVETNLLNKALDNWLYDYPPKDQGKQHYKVKYMTQISVNPLRFLLFVNKVKGFPTDWIQYAKNRIRKDLGFSSVPIELELKESSAGSRLFQKQKS